MEDVSKYLNSHIRSTFVLFNLVNHENISKQMTRLKSRCQINVSNIICTIILDDMSLKSYPIWYSRLFKNISSIIDLDINISHNNYLIILDTALDI